MVATLRTPTVECRHLLRQPPSAPPPLYSMSPHDGRGSSLAQGAGENTTIGCHWLTLPMPSNTVQTYTSTSVAVEWKRSAEFIEFSHVRGQIHPSLCGVMPETSLEYSLGSRHISYSNTQLPSFWREWNLPLYNHGTKSIPVYIYAWTPNS